MRNHAHLLHCKGKIIKQEHISLRRRPNHFPNRAFVHRNDWAFEYDSNIGLVEMFGCCIFATKVLNQVHQSGQGVVGGAQPMCRAAESCEAGEQNEQCKCRGAVVGQSDLYSGRRCIACRVRDVAVHWNYHYSRMSTACPLEPGLRYAKSTLR
jgi:hypothetical protein